jgi:hypothetical protein
VECTGACLDPKLGYLVPRLDLAPLELPILASRVRGLADNES